MTITPRTPRMVRDTDRLAIPVSPDLTVVLEDSGCIVLRTTTHEVTVSNADAITEALRLSRLYRDNPEAGVHAHVYADGDGRAERCRALPLCSTTRSQLIRFQHTHSLDAR